MISGFVTAFLLICFLGGTAWAYSGKRRQEFDEAARMPLEDIALDGNTEKSP
jgi:cytochrome c oxidase cbb3-type subunit 4